jgi:hypothetical protein
MRRRRSGRHASARMAARHAAPDAPRDLRGRRRQPLVGHALRLLTGVGGEEGGPHHRGQLRRDHLGKVPPQAAAGSAGTLCLRALRVELLEQRLGHVDQHARLGGGDLRRVVGGRKREG